jgi:hypothetical protein
MGDSEDRPREVGQAFLKGLARLDVEMVGRLVEHEEVGAEEDRPRDLQSVALPAREQGDVGPKYRAVEEVAAQEPKGLVALGPEGEKLFSHGLPSREEFLLLRAVAYHHARADADGFAAVPAVLRLAEASRDEVAEEAGLARAVRADEGGLLADEEVEGRVLEEDPVAEGFAVASDQQGIVRPAFHGGEGDAHPARGAGGLLRRRRTRSPSTPRAPLSCPPRDRAASGCAKPGGRRGALL